MEEEQAAIKKQMLLLQKLQKNVAQRLNTIRCAQTLPLHKIEQITLPTRHCHNLSEGYHDAGEMDILIERLINLDKNRLYIIGSNQIGTRISLSALQNTKSLSYQSVFLIDEQGNDLIPGGDYLCVTYRGSYSQSAKWGLRLAENTKSLSYQSVFLIDEQGNDLIPGGDYLCVTYRGSYSQSAKWGLRLAEYAGTHGLTITGELLELLWVDIHISSEESEHITQLQLPVEKK